MYVAPKQYKKNSVEREAKPKQTPLKAMFCPTLLTQKKRAKRSENQYPANMHLVLCRLAVMDMISSVHLS